MNWNTSDNMSLVNPEMNTRLTVKNPSYLTSIGTESRIRFVTVNQGRAKHLKETYGLSKDMGSDE